MAVEEEKEENKDLAEVMSPRFQERIIPFQMPWTTSYEMSFSLDATGS